MKTVSLRLAAEKSGQRMGIKNPAFLECLTGKAESR